MPDAGNKAPDFTLPDQNGTIHSLADYTGKWVVLYFYPKDNTPGCTKEACSFRDNMARVTSENAVVLGVSADSVQSHGKFAQKHDLPFPLLSDEEKTVLEAYDVWKEKNMYGRKSMGIVRTTYLINPEGVIAKVWKQVKVDGHTDQVLEAIAQV